MTRDTGGGVSLVNVSGSPSSSVSSERSHQTRLRVEVCRKPQRSPSRVELWQECPLTVGSSLALPHMHKDSLAVYLPHMDLFRTIAHRQICAQMHTVHCKYTHTHVRNLLKLCTLISTSYCRSIKEKRKWSDQLNDLFVINIILISGKWWFPERSWHCWAVAPVVILKNVWTDSWISLLIFIRTIIQTVSSWTQDSSVGWKHNQWFLLYPANYWTNNK